MFSVCSFSCRTHTPSQMQCTSQEPPNGFSDIPPSPTAIEHSMWGASRVKGQLEGGYGIELEVNDTTREELDDEEDDLG